jgi:predicted lipase
MNNSLECIFLSFLAYYNKNEIDLLNKTWELSNDVDEIWKKQWEKLKDSYNEFNVFSLSDYDIGDTQFIYSIDKSGRLLISFRGTKCLNDLLTDIRITKDKCIDICYSPFYLKHYIKNNQPYIHAGFYQMFNLMKYELYHIVRKYLETEANEYKIVITGHSLGGSLSIIASICLYINFHSYLKDDKLKLENITFGSPKVGNNEFSKLYKDLINNNTHYFHNSDPIPCVPLIGFYSTGTLFQINKFNESRLYSIYYHLLECYLKHLLSLRE